MPLKAATMKQDGKTALETDDLAKMEEPSEHLPGVLSGQSTTSTRPTPEILGSNRMVLLRLPYPLLPDKSFCPNIGLPSTMTEFSVVEVWSENRQMVLPQKRLSLATVKK